VSATSAISPHPLHLPAPGEYRARVHTGGRQAAQGLGEGTFETGVERWLIHPAADGVSRVQRRRAIPRATLNPAPTINMAPTTASATINATAEPASSGGSQVVKPGRMPQDESPPPLDWFNSGAGPKAASAVRRTTSVTPRKSTPTAASDTCRPLDTFPNFHRRISTCRPVGVLLEFPIANLTLNKMVLVVLSVKLQAVPIHRLRRQY
jgi:hypothetical protein